MSSILETFFILFESNTDQLKKGQGEAKKSSKDLEEQLSSTDRQAKALGESFMDMAKEAAGALAAAFAVEKIYEGVKAQAEYNAQLGLTAERLNVNVEDLDAWGAAAKRSGGSVEGFTASLDFLNKNMAAVEAGGQSRLKPFFEHLKIQTLDAHHKIRPLFDILGDLSDRFSKMGAQEVAGFGEKLGLDQGTVLMLQQGRRGLEDLIAREKELGGTTKEDAEIAHKFAQQTDDMDRQLKKVYTTIGSAILPSLTELLKWFQNAFGYMAEHKTAVEGFFIGVAGVITYIYLPVITEALIETLAFLAPWILIIAAVVAFGVAIGLVADDVANFLAGNESVIGELSKKWPWLGELVRDVVNGIVEIFNWAVDTIGASVDLFVALFHYMVASFQLVGRLIVGSWNATINFIDEKINYLSKRFPILGFVFRAIGEVFKTVGHAIVAVFDWILDKIAHVADFYRWFTGGLKNATVAINTIAADPNSAQTFAAVKTGRVAVATANGPVSALGSPLKAGDRTYHVTTGDIHIDGSGITDAEGVGRTVGTELEKHLRQAINHVDDGVQG